MTLLRFGLDERLPDFFNKIGARQTFVSGSIRLNAVNSGYRRLADNDRRFEVAQRKQRS
jgi:hypothetical protein